MRRDRKLDGYIKALAALEYATQQKRLWERKQYEARKRHAQAQQAAFGNEPEFEGLKGKS